MVNIFVVEDELLICEVYRYFFEITGHNVVRIARNGLEAIQMFKTLEAESDVVIMDYRMPRMDGMAAAQEIRAMTSEHLRIIFVSADPLIKEKVMVDGAAGFLAKPFSFRDLLALIENQ